MDDETLNDVLLMVVLDSLSRIEDLETVCNYNFDIPLKGNRLKGVVSVEFEEVE